MRAVDTNVLVRILVRDEEKQVASADAFVAKGVWVSPVVLAETAWVLNDWYDLSHDIVAAAIEMLLNHETISVHDAEVVAAALGHYRRRPALGFSDCLILEVARKAGHLPLGTFDQSLSKLEGTERL
ncbi:MAG TPA: type II toxin-antitoxin system VapC family toxin [Thermoanaerobaculia bacterium]|nr:type II toxin-antitoxin system VapC family toxin [Thermoanaerobaculia bacterium]